MSFLGKALSVFRKKDVGLTTKEDRIFWNGVGSYGHKEFSQVSAALRAGFVLAGGMGMMPVRLSRGGDEVKDGPEYDLIRRPNDLQTGVEFREMITMHAVYTGAGRAFIRRTASGRPVEIVPLHPTWNPAGWVVEGGEYVLPVTIPDEGYVGTFKREDIIEITNPRWDILSGMNVTNSCRNVLGLSTRLQNRQSKLSDGNAPFGVLTATEGTSKEAISKLKKAWVEQFGRSGIAVVDFEAKFTQLMQTASDQQLLETMQFQVEEIARIYGVHPYFLMQTKGSGAQGAVSDAMLFHQVHGIGPWIGRFEAALECSLLKDTGLIGEMDESALMRTTPDVRAEIYARALGAGGNKPWMTENEVRSGKSPFRLPEHEAGNALAHQKEAGNNES